MGILRVQIPERDPGPYPAGRRCKGPHCITVLRRTNPGPFCEQCAVTPFAAAYLNEQAKVA